MRSSLRDSVFSNDPSPPYALSMYRESRILGTHVYASSEAESTEALDVKVSAAFAIETEPERSSEIDPQRAGIARETPNTDATAHVPDHSKVEKWLWLRGETVQKAILSVSTPLDPQSFLHPRPPPLPQMPAQNHSSLEEPSDRKNPRGPLKESSWDRKLRRGLLPSSTEDWKPHIYPATRSPAPDLGVYEYRTDKPRVPVRGYGNPVDRQREMREGGYRAKDDA
jgi:hypothetical protein